MEEDVVFLKRLSMALLLSKDIEELCTHMGFSNRVTSVKLDRLAEKIEKLDEDNTFYFSDSHSVGA